MRVVITGFGPFPGAPFNPSATLANALARRRRPAFSDLDRATHIFATTYASVDRDLPRLLAQGPDLVLMFGLAGRRRYVCIETRARNAVSVLFPDASGRRPPHGVIARGGAAARSGYAPFAALAGATRAAQVPARLSRDAGRYLCNYLYWRALERAGAANGKPLVQFVHIPPIGSKPRRKSATKPRPSLTQLLETAEALLIALVVASRH